MIVLFKKIIYANNIHYQNEDGSYEEIDNSLIDTNEVTTYSNEDDVIGYENSNNPQKFKFSKKAHKSNMVSIKNNDYKLMWGIEGIEHKNEASITSKEDNDDEITKVMNQISQSITYPEVFENIDIEYITTSNGIKENIIIKQKQDQNEFVFQFKVKNLELVLNEDGSIHAVNEDNDVIYRMPQPYMYDVNGNTSYDVSYELEKNNNKYTLKIIADEQWLNRDDISYPIVVDPYVFTEQKKDNIQISYVSSVYHNTNFDLHKLQIGNKTSHGKCRVLVKVGLDDLNPGDMITNASLNLYQYSHWFDSSSAKEPFIAAYRVESNWNETSVTWDTQPNYDKTSVLDYDILTRTTDKWKSFDITSALKRWYDGTYGNYGIMLQLLNEDVSSTNYVYGYYLDDANSQEAGFPFISISYLNNKGLESYYDYTSGSTGSAGSYYVDNYSGNLVVEHSDDSTVGERFPASVIHYYNSYNYNNEFDTTLKVGKGWKLNIFQTIKPSSEYGLTGDSATTFPYVWMDGDGTEIYFKKVTENNTTKYIDETGRGFELTLNNPGYTITDKNDQTMTFNQHGKLIKITDINGNTNTFEYVYGLIKKVWDSAGHYLTLNYDDNGYLIEIVDMSNRKIQYQYNTYHQLKAIVYPDGYSTQYYYDSNGALIQMRNKDTTRINFEYSSLSD